MFLWSFSKTAFVHVLLAMKHILQVNHMLKYCLNEEGHGHLLSVCCASALGKGNFLSQFLNRSLSWSLTAGSSAQVFSTKA